MGGVGVWVGCYVYLGLWCVYGLWGEGFWRGVLFRAVFIYLFFFMGGVRV